MRVLRQGMSGPDVERWQQFLRGQGYDIIVDGSFGPATLQATTQFQQKYNLLSDGVVGNQTYATAILQGMAVHEYILDDDSSKNGPDWPAPPDFPPLSYADRVKIFGLFKYEPAPTPGNPEGIRVLDDWMSKNTVGITIPQLENVGYKPRNNIVLWHVKGRDQLKQLYQDWEAAGLLDRVLTWAGSYNPRFVRGSRTYLSNHAWATAFDINVPWNSLGHEPARVGQKGSVRELVEIANKNGFFWGGHFKDRPDGMHFELAKVL
jgi:hypothetical protein